MSEPSAPLTGATVLRIAEDVLRRTAGTETVILDLASEQFYGLDGVGARVFDLLAQPRSLDSVVEALLSEYAVERNVLASDVHTLVIELIERRLVVMDF